MNTYHLDLTLSAAATRRPFRRHGFSLIEVTLAIGIVAFALLSVVALLPVGLNTTKTAADQAQAIQIMKAITIAIQGATADNTSAKQYTYTPLAPFNKLSSPLTWIVKVPQNPVNTANAAYPVPNKAIFWVGPDGHEALSRDTAKYVAAISVTAPPDKTYPGKAYVMVMWPGVGVNTKGANSASNPVPVWVTPTTTPVPDFPGAIIQLPKSNLSFVETTFYFNAN